MPFNIIEKIAYKFPPDKDWRFQIQKAPPAFGWARLVNNEYLKKEVERRSEKCREILSNSKKYCDFEEKKISLVVLSCRRCDVLKRLVNSMKAYFGKTELYPRVEKILVDNGSGGSLIRDAMAEDFFDEIISYPSNVGMVKALKGAYRKIDGEYILLLEDDFILEYDKPFIDKCLGIFNEYPEVGIIRLKNQNNWWKPHRVIGPIRKTKVGTEFWTWLPSRDGRLNVWCAGSAIFRKVSYFSTGELPEVEQNLPRNRRLHQGYIYECVYGKRYNKNWLAAKIKDCYPFFQPNTDKESPGWEE